MKSFFIVMILLACGIIGRPWQKIQLLKDPVGLNGEHFGD